MREIVAHVVRLPRTVVTLIDGVVFEAMMTIYLISCQISTPPHRKEVNADADTINMWHNARGWNDASMPPDAAFLHWLPRKQGMRRCGVGLISSSFVSSYIML
jgi:hypothetical protein